eukprot:8671127-Lingulodinium_polyedra.AAC.1
MREELVDRLTGAIAPFQALRKRVLTNPAFSLPVRRAVLGSDVLSRAYFNAQAWTALNRQEDALLAARARRFYRALLPAAMRRPDAEVSDWELMAHVGAPLHSELVAVARIAYFGRTACTGGSVMAALIHYADNHP